MTTRETVEGRATAASTAALIEAVPVVKSVGRGQFPVAGEWHQTRPCVPMSDYDALRAACAAVLDDLIACRYENGAGWRISAGENGPMALNKVLPIARALREKLK